MVGALGSSGIPDGGKTAPISRILLYGNTSTLFSRVPEGRVPAIAYLIKQVNQPKPRNDIKNARCSLMSKAARARGTDSRSSSHQ